MHRIVRFVLRFAPPEFRDRFEEEIVDLLTTRSAELQTKHGRLALIRFWLRHLTDVIRTVVSERRLARRRRHTPSPSTRNSNMASLAHDTAHAVRTVRRHRAFAVVAILTLALGIGANATVFSVVNGVLLRPLPYSDSDRLVTVWSEMPGFGFETFAGLTESQFVHYQARNRTLQSFAAWRGDPARLSGDGDPELITAAAISDNLFRTIGVSPMLGRGFVSEETRPGMPDVAILSFELWTRVFGRDPNIIGTRVNFDDRQTEIIGVMPDAFRFVDPEVELLRPLRINPDSLIGTSFAVNAIGRLAPGVTHHDATAEFVQLIQSLPETDPTGFFTEAVIQQAGLKPTIHLLVDDVVGSVRSSLWILLGTVGLVMLIACANVANLFLVRAEGRQKEIAVRVALGAKRNRIMQLLLTESVLLGLVAGLVGLGIAYAGTQILVALSPEQLPRLEDIRVDGLVVVFTLGISVLSGVLFGAVPALRHSKPQLGSTLQQEGRSGAISRERQRIRGALVVTQVALALVLLIGSGLMVRSLVSLSRVDPGFATSGVLTFRVALPPNDYDNPTLARNFFQQLVDRLEGLPGVDAVGAGSRLPLFIGSGVSVTPEGVTINPDELPPIIFNSSATSGFFRSTGIPILAGRTFERADQVPTDQIRTAVVSHGFVERFWPGETGVGKRFRIGAGANDSTEAPWLTVVGVVGDVRGMGLREEPITQVYFPLSGSELSLAVAVRTAGDPARLASAVRQEVWTLNANLPVTDVRTMKAVLGESTASAVFTMTLLAIASAVALLLGTVGIYGVITYVVSQRTREIGVRIALGAKQRDVSLMVLRQGAVVVGLGVVAGLGAAFGVTRLMESLLFEVRAVDPITFIAAAVFIASASLLASFVPARRAARVDPMNALRTD